MFVPGALIFDQLKSRAVNFGVSGEPSIRIRFPDLPHLGVWTRPGAGFLCIEPGRVMQLPWDLPVSSKTSLVAYYWPPTPALNSRSRFACWERTSHPLDPSLAIRPCLTPPRANLQANPLFGIRAPANRQDRQRQAMI